MSLTLDQTIYVNNDTTDCTTVPDGWYFTDESANTTTDVYHIQSGILTEILTCVPATTTTTTTASNCFSFTISKTTVGVVAVTYTDCSGNPQTVNVGNSGGGPSTQTFCARNGSITTPPEVTLINNGSC